MMNTFYWVHVCTVQVTVYVGYSIVLSTCVWLVCLQTLAASSMSLGYHMLTADLRLFSVCLWTKQSASVGVP